MIRINYAEVSAFSRQLADVPINLRRQLRPRVRKAAQTLTDRVKSNASWSSRIPGATRIRVGFTGGPRGGVLVFVDSKAAPHARPLEFGSQGRSDVNRHPVFGRAVWVDQPTRPFFMPAVVATEPVVVREVQSAINDALKSL